MDRLEHVLGRALRVTAVLGVLCLLLVAGLSVIDIAIRELTGRPLRGANDIGSLLMIVVVSACFPAGLLERRQIKVTLIRSVIGPRLDRAMRVIAAIATGFMFTCIAWFLTLHAMKITASAEYSMVLGLPIGPWWWASAVLFWICVPAQLFVVVSEALGRVAESEGA